MKDKSTFEFHGMVWDKLSPETQRRMLTANEASWDKFMKEIAPSFRKPNIFQRLFHWTRDTWSGGYWLGVIVGWISLLICMMII